MEGVLTCRWLPGPSLPDGDPLALIRSRLIEGAASEIGDVITATKATMARASSVVLDGLEVPTDAEVVLWPDRYADPRGDVMWNLVTELMQVSAG
jgi:hypothetical protein